LGQPLCRDALGNSFGKQLRGTGGSFGRLSRTTFPNNYCFEEQQLWGAAFGGSFTDNFGEQLSVATLGRSFREPLCRMALGSRFGEQVCGIAALGQLLWGTTLGSSAGGQLWGAALGSNFGEQLRTAFRTNFEATSGRNFRN